MVKIALKFFVVIAVLPLPVIALAAVATSTNYQLERDSINIGGILSTTTNYRLEDTAGELASGTSTSANYLIKAGYQQMENSYITITSPADVTLTPAISEDNGGTANGNAGWTVATNSSNGYTLSVRSSTNPALQSGTASFSNYNPGTDPDYTWLVVSGDRAFGFTPEGSHIATRYKNDANSCNIANGSDTNFVCWDGLTTSNQVISQSSASNPSGTLTSVRFRAEASVTNRPPSGTYTSTVLLTAIAQ